MATVFDRERVSDALRYRKAIVRVVQGNIRVDPHRQMAIVLGQGMVSSDDLHQRKVIAHGPNRISDDLHWRMAIVRLLDKKVPVGLLPRKVSDGQHWRKGSGDPKLRKEMVRLKGIRSIVCGPQKDVHGMVFCYLRWHKAMVPGQGIAAAGPSLRTVEALGKPVDGQVLDHDHDRREVTVADFDIVKLGMDSADGVTCHMLYAVTRRIENRSDSSFSCRFIE